MANPWEERERGGRFPVLMALAGAGVAALSILFAAVTGEPYLNGDGVNGWIVVFALGLLLALVAFPFGLEVMMRPAQPDRDKRWERSLLIWGAVASVLFALALAAGFDTSTLAGALGLIVAIEAGLVAATVVVWLLAGG